MTGGWETTETHHAAAAAAAGCQLPWLVSVTGMTGEITAVLRQPTPSVPLMASYRGQFTRGKTCPRRPRCGDGDRRGWRLNEVKCMRGNPSWALAWREHGHLEYSIQLRPAIAIRGWSNITQIKSNMAAGGHLKNRYNVTTPPSDYYEIRQTDGK